MLSNMLRMSGLRAGLFGALVLGIATAPAAADQWNDRTILKFSSPVMVPGATLQPGTYVFRLADPDSTPHVIEISRQDTGENIALVQAVPMKRDEVKGDIVVTFNPTDAGLPPAMKGWFYPGSIYGHQLVYSQEEAKKIAHRNKTLVLSTDVAGTDRERGTLKVYDAEGVGRNWTPDSAAAASWETWRKNQRASATVVTERPEGDRSTAPMMEANFKADRISLDDLEDDASKYVGKTVSIDAEVEDVYGPRIFSIDERNWWDFEGELLVLVPSPLAAVVRDDDLVTVTGTVKMFTEADFEKEWGWLGLDEEIEIELSKQPVLVAKQIVGGNDKTALLVNVEQLGTRAGAGATARTGATGTTGTEATAGTSGTMNTSRNADAVRPVTDLAHLGRADVALVGRQVDLDRVRVQAVGQQHGFFTQAGGQTVYVLPAVGERPGVGAGQTIQLEGVVLQMPRFMKERLRKESGVTSFNDAIYVYATRVER